ncbi:hypothetical protein Fmac_012974 [Flemingia macrophylla]|uniref:Phytocyanin domain-containing protein n=1 Tax=Flemingia macrophylla TaxID=520843 RepID=A0ABD1MRW5_9FABA
MALCLRNNNASPFWVMVITMWLLICSYEAKEYVVGGTDYSWKTPLSSSHSLNHWASTHKFIIGDTLIFKYDERTESVHEVNKTDYEGCSTVGKDHVVFRDGNTKVLLNKSGFKHFISGNKSHCQMGLKLVVAINNKTKKNSHSQSPSPSPLASTSPSLSPSPLSSSSSLLSSPSPLPNNQGVTCSSGGGFIGIMVWSGVMMLFA